MSTNVLVHYNAELKVIMTMDASPVGVGAVLSHIMEVKNRLILPLEHYQGQNGITHR